MSDKSDWSDVSDLPAGFTGGHYRGTGKYRRPPPSGKQASAQDVLSQGVRLWCCQAVSDKSDWSDVSDLPADWYRVRIGTDGYGGGGNNPTGGGAVRAESYIGGRCRPTARKPCTAHNERQLSNSGGC